MKNKLKTNKSKSKAIGIGLLIFILGFTILISNIGGTYAKVDYLPITPDDDGITTTKKITYTVNFYANGGSLGTQTKTCSVSKSGNKCTISQPETPTKSGYLFDGWSTTAGCPCSAARGSASTRVSSSTNYYACWVPTYCWECSYNGVTQWRKLSLNQPSASYCQSSSWITTSNPNGFGSWKKVGYNNCGCGSTSTSPTPQPTPTPTYACYVCNSNSVTKQIMKWSTNGNSDANCSAGYTIDSSISQSNCVSKTITESYCEVDKPSTSTLECNGTKTLDSTCDKRTIVIDDVGYADVKIEQKGYISSVLTPDKTYAGGGFSFGVTYTNTIKWSYAGTAATGDLHSAITSEMNKKLKDYNSYISGININEIKFGGKTIDSSFLVKKCSASSTSIDYYNKELSVSCTFYLPDSVLKNNGDVTYTSGIGSSVSNKYYTPLDYNGNYKIEAKIVGMSRITDSAAKADGDGTSWTGTWSDTFSNCNVNLYPLLYNSNGNYNFIYRPIDIYNPFPNRYAGINWFDWYNVEKNVERLESTYDSDNLEYSTTLDNEMVADIKDYNDDHNYLEWDSINSNTGKSSFIDGYYVKREGGNS